jgi:hypothetical protein
MTMRLAEAVSSSQSLCFLAGVGIVAALAMRPTTHCVAATPIVEIEAPHELTMSLDVVDCASDVQVVNGRYLITLELPNAGECTKSTRIYHLENDHLVFER